MILPIDVILTSCGRFDLLDVTLDSFFQNNTYPIGKFVVHDDKGLNNYDQYDMEMVDYLQKKFNNVLWIIPNERVGQIVSLDRLMREVTTDYYFNLEDDWEFLKGGFIEESIIVLEQYEMCNQVQLRGRDGVNGHPSYFHDGIFKLVPGWNGWYGWGFNPSVRRLKDYTMIGSYSRMATFVRHAPWQSENVLSRYYKKLGYFTAVLPEKYIIHTGNERGIRK